MKLIEKIIKNAKVYKDLEELMESSNQESFKKQQKVLKLEKEIKQLKEQLLQSENNKKECILIGQEKIGEKVEIIKTLEKDNEKIKDKLQQKEKARRKLAGRIGGYQARINRLEKQVEFLKTNRRAPKLEEIKDYQYKRKKSVPNE